MKISKLIGSLAIAGGLLMGAATANAHIVGLGWTFNNDNSVTFDALHWHDHHSPAGFLNIDGVDYSFTSSTFDTTSMTGLDGALVNASYSVYDNLGTLSATGGVSNAGNVVDDWLHVTVSGLSVGAHILTAAYGPGGLTSWTLDGGVTTTGIVTPPSVPEPATLGLFGIALAGLSVFRRNKKHV